MALIQRSTIANTSSGVPTHRRARATRGKVHLDLGFRHGGALACAISYELIGSEDRPPIIVAGGISAGRHVLSSNDYPELGWWEVQKPAFATDWPVLAINWVGADGLLDTPIDPQDQAEAFAAVLTALGIEKAAAFIGASYGAMVGMHLSTRHPQRIGALLSISASARPHPFASACRSLQRQALSLGESGGDPGAGVALARAMAMLTYRTPEEFRDRFDAAPALKENRVRVAAEDYLDAHGSRHCQRMNSVAYRRLSESIDLHRIDPTKIRIPLTLVAVDRDALVPAGDVRDLADAVPGARFHLIKSHFGHDAFLKETNQVGEIITRFLSSLEHAQ